MGFNTVLTRFGLNPDNFENRFQEPIEIYHGHIYCAEQKDKDRICPFCKSKNL